MKSDAKHLPFYIAALTGYLLMASQSLHADDLRLLNDFSKETSDMSWFVVNDNVMGGRSRGGFEIDDKQLLFSGATNTRGGGFSSIRSRGPEIDLSAFDGIRLRVKGDGRRYTWQIRTDARYRGQDVSYWAEFDTTKDEWITIDIPFSSFVPRFRGMELNGGPPNPGNIQGLGLMINDGKDGPFQLVLDQVAAYAGVSI